MQTISLPCQRLSWQSRMSLFICAWQIDGSSHTLLAHLSPVLPSYFHSIEDCSIRYGDYHSTSLSSWLLCHCVLTSFVMKQFNFSMAHQKINERMDRQINKDHTHHTKHVCAHIHLVRAAPASCRIVLESHTNSMHQQGASKLVHFNHSHPPLHQIIVAPHGMISLCFCVECGWFVCLCPCSESLPTDFSPSLAPSWMGLNGLERVWGKRRRRRVESPHTVRLRIHECRYTSIIIRIISFPTCHSRSSSIRVVVDPLLLRSPSPIRPPITSSHSILLLIDSHL